MEKMIAFCGISCSDCPLLIATKNGDAELREKLAKEWSSEHIILKPEDMYCNGCQSRNERVISFCEFCEARNCGLEKNVINCAYCSEFPCSRLDKVYSIAPYAKATLEEIKATI